MEENLVVKVQLWVLENKNMLSNAQREQFMKILDLMEQVEAQREEQIKNATRQTGCGGIQ